MQHSAQRVGVFVDVQNMYYSARALFEQKVDFGEILKEAVGDRHLIRAFAYVISAENDDEDSFFEALASRGYELRTKKLLNFYGGNSKGDWDIGIAMDVVRMLSKIDVLVLVSGDGDFAELLKYAKSCGVRAEVMAFGSSMSSQLREEADAILDLTADPKRFLIGRRTQPMKKKARTMEGQAMIQLEEGVEATAKKPSTPRPEILPRIQQAKSAQQVPSREQGSAPAFRAGAQASSVQQPATQSQTSGAKPFTMPSIGGRSRTRSRSRSGARRGSGSSAQSSAKE